ITPSRGIIVDRNGVVLAHNYSAYTLELTPGKVDNVDATIDELATLVEITARDRRRFKKLVEESKRFESVPVRTRLTDEEIARFADFGQQSRAEARRTAAGGDLSRLRRPARRARRDRARNGRRPRFREQARLRSEPLRRRHRSGQLERAQYVTRQADGQPST